MAAYEVYERFVRETLGFDPLTTRKKDNLVVAATSKEVLKAKVGSEDDLYFSERDKAESVIQIMEFEKKLAEHRHLKKKVVCPVGLAWSGEAPDLMEMIALEKNPGKEPSRYQSQRFLHRYFRTLRFPNLFLDNLDDKMLRFANLRELNVSGNRIRVLRNLPASIVAVHIYGNKLSSFSIPDPLVECVHFGAGYNYVDSVSEIVRIFPNLRILDLTCNSLTDLKAVVTALSALELEHLCLAGNPLALAGDYRDYVITSIPTLQYLDDIIVDDEARELSAIAIKASADAARNRHIQAKKAARAAAAPTPGPEVDSKDGEEEPAGDSKEDAKSDLEDFEEEKFVSVRSSVYVESVTGVVTPSSIMPDDGAEDKGKGKGKAPAKGKGKKGKEPEEEEVPPPAVSYYVSYDLPSGEFHSTPELPLTDKMLYYSWREHKLEPSNYLRETIQFRGMKVKLYEQAPAPVPEKKEGEGEGEGKDDGETKGEEAPPVKPEPVKLGEATVPLSALLDPSPEQSQVIEIPVALKAYGVPSASLDALGKKVEAQLKEARLEAAAAAEGGDAKGKKGKKAEEEEEEVSPEEAAARKALFDEEFKKQRRTLRDGSKMVVNLRVEISLRGYPTKIDPPPPEEEDDGGKAKKGKKGKKGKKKK